MHKYKYINTNTYFQIYKYKYKKIYTVPISLRVQPLGFRVRSDWNVPTLLFDSPAKKALFGDYLLWNVVKIGTWNVCLLSVFIFTAVAPIETWMDRFRKSGWLSSFEIVWKGPLSKLGNICKTLGKILAAVKTFSYNIFVSLRPTFVVFDANMI